MKKIFMLTLCLMLFSTGYATAQHQKITLIPDNENPDVGEELSVTVQYDCTDSTLAAIGIRIHFDSAKLTYTTFQNLFETDKLADPQLQDDIADRDENAETDKLILLGYQDMSGKWPGGDIPLNLVKLVFTAKTEAITTIRVTRVTGDIGFGFQAEDAEIIIGDILKTYIISGKIRDSENDGIAGVTMSFGNDGGSAVTDSSGDYSHEVSYEWSGTVTPAKEGYTFDPPNDSYSNVTSDHPNQNYTGTINSYIISGCITGADTGISGVTVTFSNAGGSAATDESGCYTQSVDYGWSGTATPGKAEYIFSPSALSYTDVKSDQDDQNYAGTKIHPPVAGNSRLETEINRAAKGTLSATDEDKDSLSFAIVTNGTKGECVIFNMATGEYSYTPDPGVSGTDTFTFRVSDGIFDSNIATVTVTIVVPPPVIVPLEDTSDSTSEFEWHPVSGASDYRIQIDDSSSFATPIIDTRTGGASAYTPPENVLPIGEICWRVSSSLDYDSFSEYNRFVLEKARPLYLSVIPGSHDFGRLPVRKPARSERASSKGYRQLTPLEQLGAEFVESQVIVKTKPGKRSAREKVGIQADLQVTEVKELSLIGAELWQMNETVKNALYRYGENPALEYIEPNYKIYPREMPDDPDFSKLWGLHNTGQTGGKSDADIDMPKAWEIHAGGEIVVAVIDTGVDYTHPDLAPNMWRNSDEIPDNGIDDDNNGYVDDVYGYDFANDDGDPFDDQHHGTHCAGTIAAAGNNGTGVVGVNPSAKIMALKFLHSTGYGDTADAISALEYAVSMGVRITNNSWGGGTYSNAMYEAIQTAGNTGQVFVAASGNSSTDTDTTPHYPSSYPLDNIISVASTDHKDELVLSSNYGATSVDLAAPGKDIYSTFPGNSYEFLSGTSMAAPHVSGVASLIWSAYPALSVSEVKAAILSGTDPIASLKGKVLTAGRLNAYNALTGIDNPGEKTFTLSDTGETGLNIGTLSVTGPDESDFSLSADNCSGRTITSDQGCTVTVAFSPVSDGKKNAYLTIPSDDPDAPLFDVDLTGGGIQVWESVIHARGEAEVAGEEVQTLTYDSESVLSDVSVLVSGYDAVIGWNGEAERLPAPPDPPRYSVKMIIWQSDWKESYLKDIQQEGKRVYTWIIEVDPNGNLAPPVSRTSVISWNPDTFSKTGDYRLREGYDGSGEIVIEDMRETVAFPVTGETVKYFTIELIPDSGGDVNGDGFPGLEDVILALKVAAGMKVDGIHLDADVNGDGKIGIEEAVYVMQADF